MKQLQNKSTGAIGWLYANRDENYNVLDEDGRVMAVYDSLAELDDGWEDVPEEPKEYWWIDTGSIPMVRKSSNPIFSPTEDIDKEIGNHFNTEEEAEQAVERLKAFKRLKDKGFRFERYLIGGEYGNTITFSYYNECEDKTRADLDLLFCTEDEE